MSRTTSILFATHISYLDGAIEHIKIASQDYKNYHVVITLSPKQVYKNILDIRHVRLSDYNTLVNFDDIVKDWKLQVLKPYFINCASVHFLIYQEQGAINAFKTTKIFNNFLNKLGPSTLHFDSYINRQIFQIPFLFKHREKLILNVHDAKPHSGEEDKTRILLQKLLYRWSPKFVTFSDFSKNQLKEQVKLDKSIINSFLLPFNFYKNFKSKKPETIQNSVKISFVGRISKYKGIDLFVDAINKIHKELPEIEFVIAGKSFGGYHPNYESVLKKDKLTIINGHLSNTEIVDIVDDSQLIVCPYLDASQSGVVMMSLALGKPILVTSAGGLKEYIEEGENGIICEIDANDIAEKIIKYLKNDYFKILSSKIRKKQTSHLIEQRYLKILSKIYSKK